MISINSIIGVVMDALGMVAPEGVSSFSWFLIFLLSFAIFHIAISRTGLFKKKPRAGTLVSLIMAWFASSSPWVINTVSSIFPIISLVFVGLVVIFLVVFLFYKEDIFEKTKDPVKNFMYLCVLLVAVVFIFSAIPNVKMPNALDFGFLYFTPADISVIFLFVIVVGIMWYLNRGD